MVSISPCTATECQRLRLTAPKILVRHHNKNQRCIAAAVYSAAKLSNPPAAAAPALPIYLPYVCLHHAHVGSRPRKRFCACGVQVEPAAWPGPDFGGPRLRRGMLSLPARHTCCSPHTVILCYTGGKRHAYVHPVFSCRFELCRCHCRHCCCQHCRPPFVGVWEAIAGYCKGCALPQGLGGVNKHFSCSAAREKRRSRLLALQRHQYRGQPMRPHVADMPEVDFQQGALSGSRAFLDLRHPLFVRFLHATARSQPCRARNRARAVRALAFADLLWRSLRATVPSIAPIPMLTIPVCTQGYRKQVRSRGDAAAIALPRSCQFAGVAPSFLGTTRNFWGP